MLLCLNFRGAQKKTLNNFSSHIRSRTSALQPSYIILSTSKINLSKMSKSQCLKKYQMIKNICLLGTRGIYVSRNMSDPFRAKWAEFCTIQRKLLQSSFGIIQTIFFGYICILPSISPSWADLVLWEYLDKPSFRQHPSPRQTWTKFHEIQGNRYIFTQILFFFKNPNILLH